MDLNVLAVTSYLGRLPNPCKPNAYCPHKPDS